MLRIHGNLFVGRQTGGGVRMLDFRETPTWPLKPDGIYKDVITDKHFSRVDWIRLVAYVSYYHPKAEAWYLANELHTGER